ncbi:hypothetical protein AK812_SmicGene7820 [Symbiodinium microadriaticum]|uniref:Uncharacterized protein n=1 Tax=Symbiodinium microadriaticum TaxID=2951 RepID=A0A1Q9EMQ4_SYMMI|nr:hypothetical protein AK812_SmicGene7820 [Symbiodinium microadriaticum]
MVCERPTMASLFRSQRGASAEIQLVRGEHDQVNSLLAYNEFSAVATRVQVSYMLPQDYDWATADWLGPEVLYLRSVSLANASCRCKGSRAVRPDPADAPSLCVLDRDLRLSRLRLRSCGRVSRGSCCGCAFGSALLIAEPSPPLSRCVVAELYQGSTLFSCVKGVADHLSRMQRVVPRLQADDARFVQDFILSAGYMCILA